MKAICMVMGLTIFLWGSAAEAKDFAFPEIAGWKQSGEVETFIFTNISMGQHDTFYSFPYYGTASQ
jgi:hypothetical protein